MIDYKKLNEYIKNSDLPINVIACRSGMTVQSLYNKRMGLREFTLSEMLGLCNALGFNKRQRDEVFLK